MLEFLNDSALVLGRIITILPLLLFITLYMGKRAIGELPVFDFLIIVILGAIVGADIADPEIKHLPTAVAIISVGIIQRLVASLKISNRKIGRLITFEPTIVVQNGKFLDKSLKKIHYSIDNILQMLREKDIFDISEVETAIIESSGNLSVLKKPKKNTVTLEDMKISKKISSITFPVIIEGEVYADVLKYFNLDEKWLNEQLAYQEVTDIKSIFFASLNHNHDLHISLRDETQILTPVIKH
ncbi:DUF421 domain-containing protein [Cellulosilyticum sp. I15G10I2]|uniref:DUF421 domain-containing protein n=1 Tax=Cellulosilyticum sp. I15G10I2 TaxID=1892843 RepID=UPI00085C034A|nr:DUF421 domain-containing protein [Cellulosilyticum sp. I15G10I2]